MESYLFIGGAGFIGSNIIRYFLEKHKAKIIVLEPQYANVSRLNNCDVTLVQGQLNDTNIIENAIKKYKCSHVFHLVSTIKPNSTYNDYLNELQNVVVPTIRLMEVCQRNNAKLVYFSSGGAIYGESNNGKPFSETDALNPISYYGLSKLIIESNIRLENRASGLEYIIFRPSNPYGKGQSVNGSQGFIAIAIGKILSGKQIEIRGDGNSIRDYIYIEDLAKCIYDIINAGVNNATINIGSGIGTSVNDVLREIESVACVKAKVEYTDKSKFDVSNIVLDTSKMQEYTNYQLTPLHEGIEVFYRFLSDK